MLLRVTKYGESILRKKGQPVSSFDAELRRLAADMVETMHANDGAGLAAQQIGSDKLLFVVDLSWNEELAKMPCELDGRRPPLHLLMPMVFVNAELTPLRGRMIEAEEGCLSFNEIRGDVTRVDHVRVEYQDLDGAKHVLIAGDWLARVLQHEYDHTQGVLFIDRMTPDTLRAIEPRLKKLRKNARKGPCAVEAAESAE